MELNKIYEAILRFAGMRVDDEGLVFLQAGDERRPALMNGNRLVLPTEKILKSPPSTDRVIFHPLSENTLLGESEIISHLTKALNIKLNMTFGILGIQLLNLVASPEFHKHLDPDQAELLIQLKDVDDLTVTNFSSVFVNASKIDNENVFSNIYLRRGGMIHGKKYARAGFTKFPLYEELLKDPTELFGVKLRVKDRNAFKALHEFIYPELGIKQTYDAGSQSQVAPFLDALLKTSVTMAGRLNDLIAQYSQFIDNHEDLVFSADWVEAFEDLDALRSEIRRIPPQGANAGREAPANAVTVQTVTQADKDKATLAIPGAIKPEVATQPVVQPASTGLGPQHIPAIVQQGNGPAAAPIKERPATIPYNPPNYQQQQQQYMQQQMAQQQMPQQHVQVTSRGLDYASMMAVNPNLRVDPYRNIQQQMPQQRPLDCPAWAGGFDRIQQPVYNNQFMGNGGYPQQQQMIPGQIRPVMI